MKKTSIGWISSALLLVVAAGCGSGSGNLAEGITRNSPTVVSQTPASGSTGVLTNTSVTVKFDRVMDAATIDNAFKLVKPGVIFDDAVPSAVSTSDNVTFTLTQTSPPLLTNTQYRASVAAGAKDPAGNALPAAVSWTFTTESPPAVVVTAPGNGATGILTNAKILITFSRAMDNNAVGVALVQGSDYASGTVVTPPPGRSFNPENTVLTLSPQQILVANRQYTVRVFGTSKDLRGNPIGTNTDWTFTTEQPPTVNANTPLDNATNVQTDTKITVTFDRTIQSLFSAEVILGTNPPLPFDWKPNPDNTVWTFTPPDRILSADGLYTVRIDNAADIRGNTMQAPFTWKFSTEAAPVVASADPPLDNTGVLPYPAPAGFQVTVTFSKNMDAASLDNAIHLVQSGGTDIPGTVVATSATSATFTPNVSPLPEGSTFTAQVTTAAKDVRGNPLASVVSWTFKTNLPPTPAPLRVVSTFPDNNATGVSIRTSIVVNFDNAVDMNTVTATSFLVRNVTDSLDVPGQFRKFERAVIFYPDAPLNANLRLYTLAIDNTVKGASSLVGTLEGVYIANFTTGPSTILPVEGTVGGSHAAIVLDNGSLYAWGMNTDGQLGDSTFATRNTPVRIVALDNGDPLPGIMMVAAGKSHTLALDTSGIVWSWGNNTYGQLGDNTLVPRKAPVPIRKDSNGDLLPQIAKVAAGEFHSLAVDDLGNVYAWGNNASGQLGNGTSGSNQPLPALALVPGNVVIQHVAAGSRHSVALDDTGAAWAWGANDSGQLGDNTTLTRREPTQVASTKRFNSVAAGAFHTLFLDNTGTVLSTGSNSDGQLGLGTSGGFVKVPQAVPGLDNLVAGIGAGPFRSYAGMKDGTARAWGRNDSGALCTGSTVPISTSPVEIRNFAGTSFLTNVVGGVGGEGFTLLGGGDGTVWTCGRNDFGQLGNGADIPGTPLPVPVFGF